MKLIIREKATWHIHRHYMKNKMPRHLFLRDQRKNGMLAVEWLIACYIQLVIKCNLVAKKGKMKSSFDLPLTEIFINLV